MATFNFPSTSFSDGSHDVGTGPLPAGSTFISLSIDRTVPGGLESLTPSTTLQLISSISSDGGATWVPGLACSTPGGVISNRNGPIHTTDVTCNIVDLGTSRLIKATVVITNGPVGIAGNITLN